ncbi:MAG: zonular occludens toxin domain-containing protein [Hydrogenophaga sp.]|uniref:zonular occludens toxin domain-containing protein n=1 Tax=Hydrogenophaga sp. TaxID=1904254 RepID=UPI0027364208|nr:zonular occludens toxin domain-containing protein [Hydrogenophaga sp.]MDP3351570.1 zonular occludens toxin domain-containing protein [Hydrogenophaga sp.]
MTDYAYTGKKGTGKSKNFVRVARDTYFAEGRTVATNLDIYLEPMFGPMSRKTYIRVPDKPTEFDLLAAGHGNPDSYNEDKNGALGLDELGTWMNTRTFSDKGRAGVLDFLAHARKYGWDCFYLMQSIAQVDKQLRESFIEFTVRHVRFDKVRVPFIGGLLSALFGKRAGYLPKFHTAVTRLGFNPQDLKTDGVTFTGKDIEKCYDTRQVFRESYPHGTHSVLSPWHVTGRYRSADGVPWLAAFFAALRRGFRPPAPALARPPRTPSLDPDLARVWRLLACVPEARRVPLYARYAAGRSRAGGAPRHCRTGRLCDAVTLMALAPCGEAQRAAAREDAGPA